MEMGRGWHQELGVVDTIYEDDHEDDEEEESFDSATASSSAAATSRSCSPAETGAAAAAAHASLPPALRRAVQAWSRANGSREPDVIVRVQEHCLHLHRDVITSQSSYLRQRLLDSSDIAITLPAGLTFDAFATAVASCYGADAALSPATLAPAWAAAGWLGMSAEDYDGLARAAEDCFFQEVATAGRTGAAEVARSCAAFLGGEAAGPAAALLARCLEAVAASGLDGGAEWLDDVARFPVEEFLVVVEAMRARLVHDHDLLYTVVDRYLEKHKGKLTEEEKSRLCYAVSCTKLSQHVFMHLVQNPRLPLRFVVQAMLVEQLSSHHFMLLTHHRRHHHAAAADPPVPPLKSSVVSGGDAAASMTLGDILQRDSVLRQSAHIRASMQATSARIESLERELAGLRTRLRRSEQQHQQHHQHAAAIDSAPGKSASFRIPRTRLWDGEDLAAAAVSKDTNHASSGGFKSRLVHGFRNLFGRRAGGAGGAPSTCGGDEAAGTPRGVRERGAGPGDGDDYAREREVDDDEEEVVLCVEEERWRPHRRNHSVL
ncbi:hypothetical protein QOZ80_7BG0606350 [Eleusine coracana subsp. coracana]|nr:hypothetical protein QOZ80_7BG0606350 [Eleusine coracana subsp. coracana]